MLEILATFIISVLGGALGAFLLMRFYYVPAIKKAIVPLYQALDTAKCLAIGGAALWIIEKFIGGGWNKRVYRSHLDEVNEAREEGRQEGKQEAAAHE